MKKQVYYLLFLITLFVFGCSESKPETVSKKIEIENSMMDESEIEINPINCYSIGCEGTYEGPEFINGSDVAHQFSNKMSQKVGDKLKELYQKGQYSKVDFAKITMSTAGMGSGEVIYKLSIPFKSVATKCESYTSFDHVGGWNHRPDFKPRIEKLKTLLISGETLHISDLKTTKEGLQEYWIQWKNKDLQANCISKTAR